MNATTPNAYTITLNLAHGEESTRAYTLHPADPMYPVMLCFWASLATQEGVKVEARHPDGCEMPPGYVPMFLLDAANAANRAVPACVPGLMRHYGPPVNAAGARAFHFDYRALDDWNAVIHKVLDALPEEQANAIRAAWIKGAAETFEQHADKIRAAIEHNTVHELLNVPELGGALRVAYSVLPEAEAMGLVMHSCGVEEA
ncbi:hypothetical protein PA01_03140 [Azoarcus sp. PA01]|nr:hypothetical protein PA01_03140 [Azoarcus sp. PA01]